METLVLIERPVQSGDGGQTEYICPEGDQVVGEAVCETPAENSPITLLPNPDTMLDVAPYVLSIGFALGIAGAIIERRHRNNS